MKRILPLLALTCGLAPSLTAQVTMLRGRIETSAPNQFHLAATKIPLTSATLNLSQWSSIDAIMKVVHVGTAGTPLLRVESIAAASRDLDMSPLPVGGTGKLAVQAPAGATAAIFLDFASNGGFTPVPALGAWLLGSSPYLLAVGVTDASGQLPAKYAVPGDRQLVGLLITSQALVGDRGVWFLTNADRQPVVR
jgi:hypothetical protein